MKYYAFEYWDGRTTTSGPPNKKTGRMNIAGEIYAFHTKPARAEWIESGERKYGNPQRVAVKYDNLRNLCRGMNIKDFREWIGELEPWE